MKKSGLPGTQLHIFHVTVYGRWEANTPDSTAVFSDTVRWLQSASGVSRQTVILSLTCSMKATGRRRCHINKLYCRVLWLTSLSVIAVGAVYIASQLSTGSIFINPFDLQDEDFVKSLRFLQSAITNKENNDSIRLQTRVQTLRQFCRGTRVTRRVVPVQTSRVFKTSPIISTKLNLLYCPVGKIASTFMTRYVIAADATDSYVNPFDILVSEAPREKCQSLTKIRREADRVDFVKNSLKVLFVREPYSRVFSAFVDKALAPNPYYWKAWGQQAQKQAHVPLDEIGCGQNVTFGQFVRYVAATLYRTDVHLRRVTEECAPCHVGYEVIGRLETLREDVLALSGLLNVSTTSLRAVDFQDSAAHDAILDSINSSFQWQVDVLKCVTAQEMGRRLWRKMQIRGLISFRMDYPFVGENEEAVTSMKFHEAILQARRESLKSYPEDLPKQKEKALVDAYSSVSMVDMEKLAKVYTNDFLAFGYEMKPSLLFNRSNKQSDVFDVLKKWTL